MLDPNGGDGEHHDSTKCKKDCCCCRKLVANKKNIGAKWANYLDKCKTPNPCKLSKPIPFPTGRLSSNNPSLAQEYQLYPKRLTASNLWGSILSPEYASSET